jgi:iron(III) transport system substrate-binding protein
MRTMLTVTLALALLLTGCGSSEDELVIYSGRTEDLVRPLLDRFAEDTGTSIAVRYGDSAELALLLAREGDATDADVFFSQSPGAVAFLAEQDLLTELPDEVVADVDDRFVGAGGTWVGLTGRQRVVVYNQDQVTDDELPASVLELTDEQYRGRVGVAPTNGSFQDFVSAMRVQLGDDETLAWLEGLVANDVQIYANNNAIVEAVGRGEVALGLANHYYNYRFLDEDPDLPSRNHVPAGDIGALVIPSSVSIVASSDMPEAAREFVAYLLDESAQTYFRDETFEYPLGGETEADEQLPPLTASNPPSVDFDRLGVELRATTELIDRSGLTS